MAWSTRQVADLAGTTVRAVRHYHEVGLLEEPERLGNGYKQYTVSHLVRLLRIKRCADLGMPLSQVAALGDSDGDLTETLRVLEADVAASIERLQRVHTELVLLRRAGAPLDVPATFEPLAAGLSTSDRAMVSVYAQLFDEAWLEDLRTAMEEQPRTAADDDFDVLAPDADEATRQRVATGLAPVVRRHLATSGEPSASSVRARGGPPVARHVLRQALHELYNDAQLDVMRRALLEARAASASARADTSRDQRTP